VADDYLRAVAVLLLQWAWSQIDARTPQDAPRWRAPSQAFVRWVLPELDMRLAMIKSASTH
jgi:hypothetical protein